MLQQRWEAKIRQKQISPLSGLELTTTRSWVCHAQHWATRAGPCFGPNYTPLQLSDSTFFQGPFSPSNRISCEKIIVTKSHVTWVNIYILFTADDSWRLEADDNCSCVKRIIIFFKKKFNSFLHIYSFYLIEERAFGKHCGKRWNCSKWAILLFSTMFSVQYVS